MPRSQHDGDGWVVGLVEVYVCEQGDHGNVTGDREDVDGCRRLFSYVDLLMGNVVANRQCLHKSFGG